MVEASVYAHGLPEHRGNVRFHKFQLKLNFLLLSKLHCTFVHTCAVAVVITGATVVVVVVVVVVVDVVVA